MMHDRSLAERIRRESRMPPFLSLPSAGARNRSRPGDWYPFHLSINTNPPALQEEFLARTQEWQSDCQFSSSLTDVSFHPAYQAIIGMGPPAVPFILRELQISPHWWFYALRMITQVDPTSNEDVGSLERLTDRWLAWGRQQGWLLAE